jgi:hypothetical protein
MNETKPQQMAIRCTGGTRHGEIHAIPYHALQRVKQRFEGEPFVIRLTRLLPGDHLHQEFYEIDLSSVDLEKRIVTGVHVEAYSSFGVVFGTNNNYSFRIYGGPHDLESGLISKWEWRILRGKFTQTDLAKYYEVVEFPNNELAICCLQQEVTPEHEALTQWFFSGDVESFVLRDDSPPRDLEREWSQYHERD